MLLTLEKVAILKSADIFANTPDYILASVAAIAEEIDLEPGQTFIHKDILEDDMYIIVEGEVRVHDGDRSIAILNAGQVVGEMEVLAPAPRLASVSATTETYLFRLQKEAFDEVIADRYEIAQNIIRVLVERLRATVTQGA
jgi:CRP-like cAMP-binding protein